MRIRWGRADVPDFGSLLARVPDSALSSPRRSVVPLLDYWRDTRSRLDAFGKAIGVDLAGATDMAFEYTVPTPRGRGKASCTDLMILTPDAAVAVEAKFREPRYESVESWLGKGGSNREEVLGGWLELINRVARSPLDTDDVKELPYQLVHRAASACYPKRRTPIVVYLLFGESPDGHYRVDLAALERKVDAPEVFRAVGITCPAVGRKPWNELVARWEDGERNMAHAVRPILASGVFTFGPLGRA